MGIIGCSSLFVRAYPQAGLKGRPLKRVFFFSGLFSRKGLADTPILLERGNEEDGERFSPAMCSDASTQTYSQHNAALLKSSPHNLHKLSPVFARISSNNVEILLYPLLTGPLWNCAPQPYWLIVVAVSTWSFPSDFSRIPLPVTLPDYSDFVFLATSVSVKKTVVSVTPGNSCRMTGRPIFVVGRIDFVTLRTRESIIIMDCELIHNCSHSLHQGSVEWHHPPSGSSSFIRVGIRQQGPKFSPGIKNLFHCRPFFADMICEHWTAAPTVEHEL